MKTPAAALFLALTVAVLSPVLAGHTQFFYRDVTRQYQPLQAQLDTAFAQREWPAWNASTQSGVPLLANLHAGALAPWAPLFRALDFHRAYALTVALAWALFMAGLYRFLRGHLGVTPSLLGGLAGGLSGVVLGATSYLPFLAGVACLPWQLVALRQEDRFTRVASLALLFSLQLLTGDPSTALMGGLACLLAGGLEGRRHTVGTLALASVTALGLSALQLLPAWTLYEESARAQASLDTRLAWSFHPARALEWVVRLPFGQLLEAPYFTRFELAAGPDGQPFLLEHGWGVMAVLLLGAALTHRGPLRRLGVALVGLGFFLSLGKHLGPLQQLFAWPPLSLFRFPERFAALTSLGAALLTAHGAQALMANYRLRLRWALGWLGLSALLAAGALLGDDTARAAMVFTAGLVGLAGVAALSVVGTRWAWVLVVLTVGALDGVRAVSASVLTLPAEPLPATSALPGASTHRLWRENAPLRSLERPVRGRDGFAQERRQLHATFASATPGLHGVDELGGFSPVVLRRWQRVLQHGAQRPELLARLFDVGWFVSTRARGAAIPGWRPVAALADETFLYETKACGGRAWTVGAAVDVADTDGALQQLASPGFDPATTATREGAGEALPPLALTPVELAPRVRASELTLRVTPAAQWALVVVSETWAPGWRAWVDGEERPVELLDGTLLGVAVPPGGQAVVLRYEEPLAMTGLALSAATALGLALAFLRRRGAK